ncbi:hypothetical protein ACGFNP_47155 [Nonomuraea sp. NPDC049269]|uniref:hypothetical protein n=1 Tax=Nonomuraea sp. NPDC049269 TaxID=3364349 RepID=UPI0037145A05
MNELEGVIGHPVMETQVPGPGMEGLLVVGPDGKSAFNRLKKPAQRATWSRLRDQVAWLDQVDVLGDTDAWLDGIAPSKIVGDQGEPAFHLYSARRRRLGVTVRAINGAFLVHRALLRVWSAAQLAARPKGKWQARPPFSGRAFTRDQARGWGQERRATTESGRGRPG